MDTDTKTTETKTEIADVTHDDFDHFEKQLDGMIAEAEGILKRYEGTTKEHWYLPTTLKKDVLPALKSAKHHVRGC